MPEFLLIDITDIDTEEEAVEAILTALDSKIEKYHGEHDQSDHGNWAHEGSTESPAFRKWFGDSKIVDSDGKPLVVYHGTNRDFREFDVDKRTDKHGRQLIGAFFSANSEYASSYGSASGDTTGRSVIPAYVKLTNPLVINEDTTSGVSDFQYGKLTSIDFLEKTKASGYDGIIYNWNDAELGNNPFHEVVVFSANDIKSKFNKGTYDPKDNRISYEHIQFHRPLSKYESRVNFAKANDTFARLISETDEKLRNALRKSQKDIIKKATDAINILNPSIAGTFKVDVGDEFYRIFRDFLLNAWRDGKDHGFDELPENIADKIKMVKQFDAPHEYDAYQPREDNPGIMVAVEVPIAIAEKLAILAGNKPEDLHCTLVYLGRLNAIGNKLDAVRQAIRDVAANHSAMNGKINGLGRFGASESSDNKEVVYATLDCPGLTALRTDLVDAIEFTGVSIAKDHDFTPHITLSYVEPDESPNIPLPDFDMMVNEIALIFGDHRDVFELGAVQQVNRFHGDHDQSDHGNWAHDSINARIEVIKPIIDAAHEVNQSKVDDIKRAMLNGEQLPPVVVVENTGNGYYVIDGHHRMQAARDLGREIEAWVVSRDDFESLIQEKFDGNIPDRLGDLDDYIRVNDKPYRGRDSHIEGPKNYAGFEPRQAIDYLTTKALVIKGLLDNELTEDVRQLLLEHLKGGRTLTETLMDLRELFEPWVGDPEKIAPSGQVGINTPPGTKSPDNVLQAYRLENMIRTPIIEAYNQGRLAIGDAADEYVIGYEYSALLDTRTCLRENSLIKLANGKYREIAQIKPGDRIVSGTGVKQTVAACWRYPATRWIRLTLDDGREVVCTATHQWWTASGWTEALDIEASQTRIGTESWGRIECDSVPSVWPRCEAVQQQSAQVLLKAMLPRMDERQSSKEAYMSRMQEDVLDTESGNAAQILLPEMLLRSQISENDHDLQRMRQEDDRSERFDSRRARQVLQSGMPLSDIAQSNDESLSAVRQYIFDSNKQCGSLRSLFAEVQQSSQASRHSDQGSQPDVPTLQEEISSRIEAERSHDRSQSKVLFQEVSTSGMAHEASRESVSALQQADGGCSQVIANLLFEKLLDEIEASNSDRIDGGESSDFSWHSLPKGNADRSILHRLLSFTEQPSLGDGRRVLAFASTGSGCKEGRISQNERHRTDQISLQDALKSSRRFTAPHANHEAEPTATNFVRVLKVEEFDELAWAYDLEVEDDHSYIANGLISHNTEICQANDGLIIRKDDPRLIKLTPPVHFQALAEGTAIRTRTGVKPIELIRLGDEVLTHRRRYMPVYAVMARDDIAEYRELLLSTGKIIRVSDEHPILTSSGWKVAEALKVGDVLYQHANEPGRIDDVVLSNPENFPSPFDQPLVPYKIMRLAVSRIMILPVDLKNCHASGKGEVGDIRADRILKNKLDAASRQYLNHSRLSDGRRTSIGEAFAISDSMSDAPLEARISGEHALRVPTMNGARFFSHAKSPMFRTAFRNSRASVEASSIGLTSNGDSVVTTKLSNHVIGKSSFAFERSNRSAISPVFRSNKSSQFAQVNWHPTTIVSISNVVNKNRMWNLAVEDDETYLAEDVVVHNCRSLLVYVTTDDTPIEWSDDDELDEAVSRIQEGFA